MMGLSFEIAGIVFFLGVVAWLWLSGRLSRAVDPLLHGLRSELTADPLSIDFDPDGVSSWFLIGSRKWPLHWPSATSDPSPQVSMDDQRQLSIGFGGRRFRFGPVTQCWQSNKTWQYLFFVEAEDNLSFRRETGRLPWPTPFSFSMLGGSVPRAKRYLYHCLQVGKRNGDTLTICWRGEMCFYRGAGWCDTFNDRLSRITIKTAAVEPKQR